MISKSIFWAVTFALFTIAVAVAWVARERGVEVARLRQETREVPSMIEAERKLCGIDRAAADKRASDAEARAKDADARATAARAEVGAWQAVAIRSGIVRWFGEHGRCVGRGADGHCTKYRMMDGQVFEVP